MKGDEDDSDDEDYSLDSEGEQDDQEEEKGNENDDMEYQEKRGRDLLMDGTIDIPRVDDIPVISKLVNNKEKKPKAE